MADLFANEKPEYQIVIIIIIIINIIIIIINFFLLGTPNDTLLHSICMQHKHTRN